MNSLGITGFRDIVASLLVWLSAHTGYAMPENIPEVHFVSRVQLQALACAGQECPVIAFHHHERGIMLEDSFAKVMGLCELSILLHELTHFLQRHQDGLDSGPGPGALASTRSQENDWALREMEAYRLQKAFLDQYAYRYRPKEVHYGYNFRPGAGQGHIYTRGGCQRSKSGVLTSLAR